MTDEAAVADVDDVIDRLAAIAAGSPLSRLRGERPDAARFSQRCFEALLEPDDPAGMSREERETVALRVALLSASVELAAFHRGRLRALGVPDERVAAVASFPAAPAAELVSARLASMLRQTDRVTVEPGSAEAAHIADLAANGLEPRDIVTLGQLIGFLSYQVRVLAGLRALGGIA
ncbi:MAG: CMD domain protein [Thermomicrobiales bacterium]